MIQISDVVNAICTYNNLFFRCLSCNSNLCTLYVNQFMTRHTEHDKIFYGSIIPDKKDLEDGVTNLKKSIKKLKEKINSIIKKLNEILQNILDMKNYNKIFCDRINELGKQKDIVDKFQDLMDIHNQITINNEKIEKDNYQNYDIKKIKRIKNYQNFYI